MKHIKIKNHSVCEQKVSIYSWQRVTEAIEATGLDTKYTRLCR